MSADRMNPDERLAALIDRVAAGGVDALTAGEVAELEAALADRPELEARLEALAPPPDAFLTAVEQPTAADWERVWQRVERASTRGATLAPPVLLRVWRPVAAIAACALLALSWQVSRGANGRGWSLKPASGIEVHSLEVFGESVSLILPEGSDGFPVIWVFDMARDVTTRGSADGLPRAGPRRPLPALVVAGLAGLMLAAQPALAQAESVDLQVLVGRASEQPRPMPDELKDLAEQLRRQTGARGFTVERRIVRKVELNKPHKTDLVENFAGEFTAQKVEGRRVAMRVRLTQRTDAGESERLNTVVSLDRGKAVVIGGFSVRGRRQIAQAGSPPQGRRQARAGGLRPLAPQDA